MKLRIGIAQVCNASSPLSGEVEFGESYFGARRVRGKKGRGAGGKTIVFGILERHGKVTRKSSLTPPRSSYRERSGVGCAGSSIHSDGWRGYNGLVDMGYKKRFRVHHGDA